MSENTLFCSICRKKQQVNGGHQWESQSTFEVNQEHWLECGHINISFKTAVAPMVDLTIDQWNGDFVLNELRTAANPSSNDSTNDRHLLATKFCKNLSVVSNAQKNLIWRYLACYGAPGAFDIIDMLAPAYLQPFRLMRIRLISGAIETYGDEAIWHLQRNEIMGTFTSELLHINNGLRPIHKPKKVVCRWCGKKLIENDMGALPEHSYAGVQRCPGSDSIGKPIE